MITRKLLNEFASNAVRYGPGEAVHRMLGEWRFQSTPMMDNSAPSAYTDRAVLDVDLGYAEFADIVGHVQKGHPDQAGAYSFSNKTEAGLMALRVFDRTTHTSDRDIAVFSAIFEATTNAMIRMHDAKVPWMTVSVPWMREILETNMDIMPVHRFRAFIHESSLFNQKYIGGSEQYLDSRIFADDQDLKFGALTFLDQGLRAIVNNCFNLKVGEHITVQKAVENESGVLRLAQIINDLHALKVTTPAYQKNLILTGELMTILSEVAEKRQDLAEVSAIHTAIQSLVDMTMTPIRKVGQIRENRLRPRHTAERLRFWSTTDSVDSLSRLLPRLCSDLPFNHADKGVQEAMERFRRQISHDAYQAVHNMTPHASNKRAKEYPLAYFRLAVDVSPEGVDSEISFAYLSKLEKDDLANMIGTLSSNEAKVRLMKQHPGVKGAVLMNDLGM